MSNNGNQNQPAHRPTTAAIAKQYTDMVETRVAELVNSGGIHLPADYSAANAVRAAFLKLQDVQTKDKQPVLAACTRHSITNALLSMVVQGLNVDKNQGYFIAYGDALTFQRSYFGAMAVARRVNPNIAADGFAYAVVYEGDDFEFSIRRGKRVVEVHRQRLENIDKGKIIAAYCEVYGTDGQLIHSELMTMDEIKQAWRQSKMYPVDEKGNIKTGSTHDKFTADMALKTVINKTTKPIINSSSDRALLSAVRGALEIADEHVARAEAAEHANGEIIDLDPMPSPEPHALPHDAETGEVLDMPEDMEPMPLTMSMQPPAAAQAGPGY